MPVSNSLILFTVLALLSLVVVSLANRRERGQRARQARLNSLARRVQRLDELVIEVDPLLESRAIARLLNDEMLALLENMRGYPESAHLDDLREAALARSDALSDESLPVVLHRLKESDVQIACSKKNLLDTSAVLKSLCARHKISVGELHEFNHQLSWALLMVETLSLIGQGHKATRHNNVISAHAFYKKAQHTLLKSSLNDPRRQRLIREMSEILASARVSLSEDLMPESHLNPLPRQTTARSLSDS